MPGAGISPGIMTADRTGRVLDVTRLVSRVGRGPLTGIDRVELAYLRRLSAGTDPLFLLIGTATGTVLLPGMAAGRIERFLHWRDGRLPPKLRVAGALAARARAFAALLPMAIGRGRSGRVLAEVTRGATYVNVGHANLGALADVAAAGLRSVVMVHDTIPLDLPHYASRPEVFRQRLQHVARHADRVICPSAATAESVARWCTTMGRVPRLTVAALGIDARQPGPLPPEFSQYRAAFVSVGTVEPRKNHALLLDVWDRLAATMEAPPLLAIIGSPGWGNRAVLDRLARLPANGPVRVLAGLSDATVTALVAEARALLMPSFAEGFGLPVAEAAAVGTPAVCGPLPVYREIVGDYPVYVDQTDMYGWERTIRTLAEQPFRHLRRAGEVPLPTWDDHFNLALNMV